METSKDTPALRIFIGPARSGTTVLLKSMSHIPGVRTSKSAIIDRRDLTIDYSIYERYKKFGAPFVVHKENLGRRNIQTACKPVFRDDEDIENVRPLFVLRDPVQTYNSWHARQWGSLALFLANYRHLFNTARYALDINARVRCVTYEHLTSNTESIFAHILSNWGIPYDERVIRDMAVWPSHFNIDETMSALSGQADDPAVEAIMAHSRKALGFGTHATVMNGEQRIRSVKNELVIDAEVVDIIENRCREIYEELAKVSREQFSVQDSPAVSTSP